ncbi:MAG: RluA family pseudouridine synthase [Clostridia bacterium]|nr:RluA family pseudouridine synthase [Clostridia bacterium]
MNYIVDKEDARKRLDIYISEKDETVTRSYVKNLIDDGRILVNGVLQKSGYKVKESDIILVDKPKDEALDVIPEDIKVDIIYEDNDIIIVNKEKGMVVHPANGNYTGTLVNSLMYSHRNELSSINGTIRPGIVHRIDKDTSGILVVAKNDKAHKKLSEDFKEHHINRKYVALVKGIVKEDEFTIDLPIGRSPKDRKKMAVVYTNSRRAVTHIRVLKRFYSSQVTLVEATLETGRTHQIRVHMSYMHHPLVGDEIYGKKDSKWKINGQMLHAKLLGITHPSTGKYMEFESDIPSEFKELLEKLEKKEEKYD